MTPELCIGHMELSTVLTRMITWQVLRVRISNFKLRPTFRTRSVIRGLSIPLSDTVRPNEVIAILDFIYVRPYLRDHNNRQTPSL